MCGLMSVPPWTRRSFTSEIGLVLASPARGITTLFHPRDVVLKNNHHAVKAKDARAKQEFVRRATRDRPLAIRCSRDHFVAATEARVPQIASVPGSGTSSAIGVIRAKDTHCILSRKTAAANCRWRGRHDRGIASLTWGLDSTARLRYLLYTLLGDSLRPWLARVSSTRP